MTSVRPLVAVVMLLAVVSVRADNPATDTPPLSPEHQAVVDALRIYNEAMMSGDEAAMVERQHAVTEGEKSLSASMIRIDLAVGQLKKAVVEVFANDKAAATVGVAMNDISNDEIPHARVQMEGEDRAVLSFVAPSRAAGVSIKMIRVDGIWKFDMTQPPEIQDQLVAAAGRNDARARQVQDLVAAVKIRAFDSLGEVIEEIRRRGL